MLTIQKALTNRTSCERCLKSIEKGKVRLERFNGNYTRRTYWCVKCGIILLNELNSYHTQLKHNLEEENGRENSASKINKL